MKFKLMMLAAMSFGMLNAATYDLKLYQDSSIAGTTLKPGEYKMTVDGDKVTIKNGKTKIETNAKVEAADKKFNSTSVRYLKQDGKDQVQEIHVGGTKNKVVLF